MLGIVLSIFFGFIPMFLFALVVYLMDRYEKEPLLLLGGVFTWGALVAAGGAFILNTVLGVGIYLFTESDAATTLITGSFIAPVVEESLKGFAVLIVFLFLRREFDSILDGIIYAAIVALGFAATENAYYIYSYGYAEDGLSGLFFLVFVRVILVGWQHPFYTAFIGIGLALARLNRAASIKILAPVVGWAVAVLLHGLHNGLASLFTGSAGWILTTLLDWGGWLLMLLFVFWIAWNEQRTLANHLKEEVALGNLTASQYRAACSTWIQTTARLTALLNGQFRNTDRFYQVCGELAHKKEQRERMGEETGNSPVIAGLRTELARLSPYAVE